MANGGWFDVFRRIHRWLAAKQSTAPAPGDTGRTLFADATGQVAWAQGNLTDASDATGRTLFAEGE